MLLLSINSSQRKSSEAGAIFFIVALALIPIITVVALLVDAGNSMRNQTSLKTALDAGALRGAQALFENKSTADAQAITEDIVEANLLARGFSPTWTNSVVTNLNIGFFNSDSEISVASSHAVPAVFAKAIPGFGEVLTVGAVSRARMSRQSDTIVQVPASFTLVLDESGSMNGNEATGKKKIDALKDAVKSMLTNSTQDEFRFNSYSTNCNDESFAYDMTSADDKGYATDWIDQNLNANGWTNISCGLKKAYELQQLAKNAAQAVILLTDGVGNRGTQSTECCSTALGGAVCWADKIKTDLNVPVFTIGFGKNSGSFNPDFLKRVAGVGEGDYGCGNPNESPDTDPPGDYLEAPDEDALKAAFESIVRQISSTGEDKHFLVPSSKEL